MRWRAFQIEPEALFQEPRWGVPGALRAFQIEPEALFQEPEGSSRRPRG